jgi:hypothetical protein
MYGRILGREFGDWRRLFLLLVRRRDLFVQSRLRLFFCWGWFDGGGGGGCWIDSLPFEI